MSMGNAHCGSTNTEPGAVATGAAKDEVHRACKVDQNGDVVFRKSNPVATAPGSVFIGPRQGRAGTTALSGLPMTLRE